MPTRKSKPLVPDSESLAALERFVERAGGQDAAEDLTGIPQGSLSRWLLRQGRPGARHQITLETADPAITAAGWYRPRPTVGAPKKRTARAA